MTIPSRWLPFVLDVATRPGRLQSRAEKLVQDHQAARGRRLARSLPRRKAAKAGRAERTGARAALRAAVFSRAAGRCECCGLEITTRSGELDHYFGRARSENVETCWLLCRTCHGEKTENRPNRRWWLERFRRHAVLHGYGRAIAMVDQQLALEPQGGSAP